VTPPPAPKYVQAAALVRAQVADGTLKPGEAAASGAQLARLTGFCALTCRKALRNLIKEGVLTAAPSTTARPRVAVPFGTPAGDPARDLSRALAAPRHKYGLSQPALAALAGYSVTTIGGITFHWSDGTDTILDPPGIPVP
jgi:DNA-binding transcriptional MocR family regulator